jgi:biopolymer transport protein ExbB/TolQ
MENFVIPDQLFILILVIIVVFFIIFVIFQWRKISQSKNEISLIEKEIELKKMAMVEKDLESKRLMENPIQLPQEQQDNLSQIRQSTSDLMNDIGYKHTEINERLARLEAQTEQKKLEKMLKEIEEKEKKLNKK